MALTGDGFLAMWHDIASEAEEEYNCWHTQEHMPERVGIPGFKVARRYVDWNLELHRYFTLYEGQAIQAFDSPDYIARLNAPTSWTQKMMQGVVEHGSRRLPNYCHGRHWDRGRLGNLTL